MRDAGFRRRHAFDVIVALVAREHISRYRNSVLGVVWTVLHPVLFLLTFFLLFKTILRIEIESYASFVFIGVVAWNWLLGSMMVSVTVITGNASFVGQPGFPLRVLPIVAVLSNFVTFLITFPFLLLIVSTEAGWPGAPILAVPFVILCQMVLLVAFAYFLAALNVVFRDVQHILPIFIQLCYFMSPIFYDFQMVPEQFQGILSFNPMVHILTGYRDILIQGQWPDWLTLALILAVSLALVWLGDRYFERSKYRFLEEI